jgi:hypothetical protein
MAMAQVWLVASMQTALLPSSSFLIAESFGELEPLIRLWLYVFLPALSLAHGVSILLGVFFALGERLVFRLLAVLVSLSLAAGVAWAMEDYAVSVAAVAIITVWLVAGQCGVRLVRQCFQAHQVCTPRSRWRFLSELLLWLPVAVGYLFAAARLCPPWQVTADYVPSVAAEAAFITVLSVGAMFIFSEARPCVLTIVVLLGCAWPVVFLAWLRDFLTTTWVLPFAVRFILGLLLWGTAFFPLMLLACRHCGYRLVWAKRE